MPEVSATVVIPTIGRPEMLARAVDSLLACDPPPAEIVVVDQSADASAAAVVERHAPASGRLISSGGIGRGLAVNEGLRAAENEVVFITDDDCTVRNDWIRVGLEVVAGNWPCIVSGQVLAGGEDVRQVPATHIDPVRRDYTGDLLRGTMMGGNMLCPRSAVLELGGFDEQLVPASEDSDLSHRWLRAGRRLLHEPELIVWHRGWRSPDELERLYVGYHRSRGMFMAKLLRAGDRTALYFIAEDYYQWLRSLYSGWVRGVPRWADHRRGTARGFPGGLLAGWRMYKRG